MAQPKHAPSDASPVPSRGRTHGAGRGIARSHPLRRRATPPATQLASLAQLELGGGRSLLGSPLGLFLPSPQRLASRLRRRLCSPGGILNRQRASRQWVSSRPTGVRQRATDSIASLCSPTRSETWTCWGRTSPASFRHAAAGGKETVPWSCQRPRIPSRDPLLRLWKVTAHLDSRRQLHDQFRSQQCQPGACLRHRSPGPQHLHGVNKASDRPRRRPGFRRGRAYPAESFEGQVRRTGEQISRPMNIQTSPRPAVPGNSPPSRPKLAGVQQSAGTGRDGWRAAIPGRDGCGDGTAGRPALEEGVLMREAASQAAGLREEGGDSVGRRMGPGRVQASGFSRGAFQGAVRARARVRINKGARREVHGTRQSGTSHRKRWSATGQRRQEAHAGSSSARASGSGA